MTKFLLSLCLITAVAPSVSAHASSNCYDEIREAAFRADGRVEQGESCQIESVEINAPQLESLRTGSLEVRCGSGAATIEFGVSPAPSCNVHVFSRNTFAAETGRIEQTGFEAHVQSRACGYAPLPPCSPACNPRIRPCYMN